MALLTPKEAIEKLVSIGWSQAKVARYVGCDRGHISRIRSCQRNRCDYRIADKLREIIENLKNYHEGLK